MFAIGIIYAPLAPLVSLLAAVSFFASAAVYKYLLVFVFGASRFASPALTLQ